MNRKCVETVTQLMKDGDLNVATVDVYYKWRKNKMEIVELPDGRKIKRLTDIEMIYGGGWYL